jgi:hypothetical protein
VLAHEGINTVQEQQLGCESKLIKPAADDDDDNDDDDDYQASPLNRFYSSPLSIAFTLYMPPPRNINAPHIPLLVNFRKLLGPYFSSRVFIIPFSVKNVSRAEGALP